VSTRISTHADGGQDVSTCATELAGAIQVDPAHTRRGSAGPRFCGPVCFHAWYQQRRHDLTMELAAATGGLADTETTHPAGAVLAGTAPAAPVVARTWLRCSGGPERVTELGLCEFLWYQLPVTTQDPMSIAAALGDLFEAAELPRYAQICRSAGTTKILRTYGEDGIRAGRDAFARALRRSGVVPPEVPELTWATAMGTAEVEAYEAAAAMLELAVIAGELTPGAAGWRSRQAELTREYLTAVVDGPSLLDRVRTGRVTAWTRSQGSGRRKLTAAVAERISMPVTEPFDAAECLAPLRWLLARADRGRGIPLGDGNGVAPSVVAAAQERFGVDATEPLRVLGELLLRMRLLRRAGRRWLLTRAGSELLADPRLLWQTAVGTLIGPAETIAAAAAEAALLLLVHGRQIGREELARGVCELLIGEGWRDSGTGALPTPELLCTPLAETWRRLHALGLLADDRWLRPLRLTPTGQAAAFAALRTRALRPRHIASFG
jgi:hypothetical protein